MQSLIEQAAEIVALGAKMQTPANTMPCACTAMNACWYHRDGLIRSRRMTRAQWAMQEHTRRQRRFEREQQERDEENFRETYGYAMPYSMRLAAGHEVEEADSE